MIASSRRVQPLHDITPEIYSEGTEECNPDELKDLREKLEIKYGAKLSRTKPLDEVH